MSFRTVVLSFSLLVLFTLQGCGPRITYSYSPPETEAGMNCVRECNTQRGQCKMMAQMQASNERALYDAKRMAYDYCSQNKDKKKRSACVYPFQNYNYGDSCGDEYQACYQGCGGIITPIIHQD
ncbi:hypothetical protein [Pseudomonas purpurea]|uniref:hypothetical protein n=1 Tax=Pseudomonas purpurea TaxID=3136737 RepID=UPI0032646CC1